MSDALKPCPHCDGTDIRCFRHSHLQGEPCVMCRTCFASAISPAAWNTRATDAAIPINCREWNYYPILMLLNNQGQGPATIGDDASLITYEVWDRLLITCASFDNLPDAINESIRLILEGEK